MVFAAGPFVAAIVRMRQSGDPRMIWMALAAFLAAAVAAAATRSRSAIAVAVATLVVATLAAGTTRILLGGQDPLALGLWLVAGTFGLFFAVSAICFADNLRRRSL